MSNKHLILTLLTGLVLYSCGNVTNIAYIQDLNDTFQDSHGELPLVKAQSGDKLSIVINSKDPQLADLFNLPVVAHRIGFAQSSSVNSSQQMSCYTIDGDGYIDFPVLGSVKVLGMTRSQIAEKLKTEMIERDLIKDPVVIVEFGNHFVSVIPFGKRVYHVLGEVSRQGRYAFDRDRMSILEALAMAGDLTIYGKRENVKVLREENGTQHIYTIDLTKGMQMLKSPAYYVQQGDIIYVEPNETRALQSTLNGNTVRSTSFWISIGSLLTAVTSVLMVILNSTR